MKKIITNKIRCKKCGDVIESTQRKRNSFRQSIRSEKRLKTGDSACLKEQRKYLYHNEKRSSRAKLFCTGTAFETVEKL